MLATGRNDRRGAQGRGKNGRSAAKTGADARFEVLNRVGEGTLWVVYRVRHRESGQAFALKALKNVFNRHPRLPDAILAACEPWRGQSHPHLASVLESGREDDTLFLTGEWLPGGSLESRLNRALTRDEIVSVLRSAASVLAWTHSQNLTHGDIRPRQFLFDASGGLKLTDVGIAAAFAAAGLALADVQPDAAWYLAPERTQGATLAPPADLYALGVMLYRMLAGRVPFDGPSALSIALRHRSDTPLPPSQFNPRCPADLERLAMRLLEKDPQRRLDAPGLVKALQAFGGAPIIAAGVAAKAPQPIPTAPAPSANPKSAPVATAPAVAAAPVMDPAMVAAAVPIAAAASTAAASAAMASTAMASTAVATQTLPNEPLADSSADEPITVDIPRRRELSPIVDKALATQKEEEVQLDRKTLQRRHKRREFWGAFGALFWLLVFTGAFGGSIYGAYVYWGKETPVQVRVPNYLGLEQNEARQRLSKAGLTLRVGRETYDAKKAAGTVVSGEPEPGRLVRSRREVTVTISQGEAPLTMSNFTELPLATARAIISQHAMRLGQVSTQYHDTIPPGYICGQFPEAGESFRRSDPITLIVSRGHQPTEIDATKGEMPPLDLPGDGSLPDGSLPDGSVPAAQLPAGLDQPGTVSPGDPAPPFGAAAPTLGDNKQAAITRTAVIRVQIPSDGGPQQVRVVVRDADGERVVYSKKHQAGDEVEETVRVRRPQGATARVQIYVGASLIKEEQL